MKIKFLLGQLNFRVGDLQGNAAKIRKICQHAIQREVKVVIFPEMALSGYPIKDLIFDRDFLESEKAHLGALAQEFPDLYIILGGFGRESDPNHHPKYQNNAILLFGGEIQAQVAKRLTPTYDVFDEKRYFWSGTEYSPIFVGDIPVGLAICEDLWDHDYQIDVAHRLAQNGAQIIISINGSPYFIGKQQIREEIVQKKAASLNLPIIYLNAVGGQDELVFDGRSFAYDSGGHLLLRGAFCREQLIEFEYDPNSMRFSRIQTLFSDSPRGMKATTEKISPISPLFDVNQEICEALALNLRDYYQKTGVFENIVVGLSGGVDSAFTAYIAAQAIGPDKVVALLMPSKYSSSGSIDDSIALCQNLGVTYHIVPIKSSHALLEGELDQVLTPPAKETQLDLAHQNLQSRLRGVILMYYSNKYNALVVSTGNKSEIATGYCTLYGDTNGGKNVPGDIYKTQLYQVCEWINREQEIIPRSIITKPPSAELKEDQVDEDNLPPYPVLDKILHLRIDEGLSPREIIALGHEADLVRRIEKLYTRAEFKRAQLAQTIKINKKTFGSGRKIPVLKHATY